MHNKIIKQSVILNCLPSVGYAAWMDSKIHSRMIAGGINEARIEPTLQGEFSIWDHTITGKTLELHPHEYRIVQSWRYEYPDWSVNLPSHITIEFIPYKEGKCKLQLLQVGVPDKYIEEIAEGWREYYWKPMQEYFSQFQ